MQTDNNISVSREILKSAKWNTISLVITYGSLFINLIVLGRFVDPSEHGRAAIAVGIAAFFMLFSRFGFGNAIVAYKQEADKRFIDTMFTVSILFSGIIYGIFFALSPMIGRIYGDYGLPIFLRVAAASVFFIMITGIPLAIIQRSLNYKGQTFISMGSALVNLIFTIFLAIMGYGVWALIAPAFAGNTVGLAMAFFISKYKPWIAFDFGNLKRAMNFGISGMISDVSNFVCGNIVQVVMGKVWKPDTLGFYSFAERQYSKPADIIISQLVGSIFPIISRISDDLQRIRHAYLRLVRLGFFLISPVYSILIIGAPFIFGFLFGHKWDAAVLPFQLFAVLAYIRTFCIGSTGILSALKSPHWNAIIVSIRLAIYCIVILFSWINRIDLITMIYFIISIDSIVIMLYTAAVLIRMRCGFLELWHVIKIPLMINIILFAALFSFVRFSFFDFSLPGIRFIIGAIIFSLIYVFIGYMYLKDEILVVINHIRK